MLTIKQGAMLIAGVVYGGQAMALSGRVINSDGEPIDAAVVDAVDRGVQVTVDSQGRFTLPLEGVDELHVEAPGYSHEVLHLHDDAPADLVVVLKVSAIEQVDVIGLPLHASTVESAQPISVLGGEALRSKQASTLGETLAGEVGVHSSYFGPVASSPIIRGLDGPRVLVAQNGLDAGDVSRLGPDHVVSTEASTATQIEILRGPATLFFGSGAIGGVVNVVDDRVPTDNTTRAAYSLSHNTVANENGLSAALTSGVSSFAFHADGYWRENDDYDIPVPAEVESAAEHEAEGHEEHALSLANSEGDASGGNIGASWLLDNGYVGLSFGRMDKLNGVPGHSHEHAHEHVDEDEEASAGHEDEAARVMSDLSQNRWQLLSELTLDAGWLTGVNTRFGYTDYEHTELHELEDGRRIPETRFTSETQQLRVDLLQDELAGWRGAYSVELMSSSFAAEGEEAFTPPTDTVRFALAVMEERHSGPLLWQLGARLERVEHDADLFLSNLPESRFGQLHFTPASVSLGTVWDFSSEYNLGVSLTHAERAPSAGELYAAGPHIATGTYELGATYAIDTSGGAPEVVMAGAPDKESSANIDLSLRKHKGSLGVVLNGFYNRIDNYYALTDTGFTTHALFEDHEDDVDGEGDHEHESDELPVYHFQQRDAEFWGAEAEANWQLSGHWRATFWGDLIRGKLTDGANLPRIPPARLGTQIQYRQSAWQAELAAVRNFAQRNVGALETETNGYTLVSAQISYTFAESLTLFLKGDNLTDTEARVHSSFLKDVAPLPARGFKLGVRGNW